MTKDMTQGRALPLILKFMVPLLLGNLFQQTYNIVDAAIVGRILGSNALAAVGASSSVQFLVLGFCMGTCCGFAIPIAQRFGAKDYEGMKSYVFHSCILTAALAVILTVICTLACTAIMNALSTPEEIFADAYTYQFIIFSGIPCTLLYNLMANFLRAVGNSRVPFFFLAVSTCINIVLDLFFIVVLGWGVSGAAIATITAQGMSGILCLIYIIRRVPVLHPTEKNRRFGIVYFRDLIVMGVPMGLQYSITAIGSMVMQSANNSLGTVYVTAFTAASRIKQFALCPIDALSTAVATFCSQNLGAKQMDRVKRGLKDGVVTGVLYGVFAGLILIFAGRGLCLIFVSNDAASVLDAASRYLRCMGYCFWILGVLCVVRQAVQGIGYAGRAVFAGVVEMIARCCVSIFLVPLFGFGAICWSDQSAWFTATVYIVITGIFCMKKAESKIRGGESGIKEQNSEGRIRN